MIRAVVVWLVVLVGIAMTNPIEATARSKPPQRYALRRPSIRTQVPIATDTVWPRQEVLDLAMRAYRCGRDAGAFVGSTLTVIDYSLPSSAKRLWVLDVARRRVLFHELVAHGENSGDNYAVEFSNEPGSRQSSIGVFRTEDSTQPTLILTVVRFSNPLKTSGETQIIMTTPE